MHNSSQGSKIEGPIDNLPKPSEVFKVDKEIYARLLLSNIKSVWRTEKLPSDWNTGAIQVPRKGSQQMYKL